jgi:hypothetical protein
MYVDIGSYWFWMAIILVWAYLKPQREEDED